MPDDDSVEIQEYTGMDTEVTVPSEIDGHKVTSIGGVFFCCKSLKEVTIPKNITEIADHAFGYYFDENWNLAKVDGLTIYCYKDTAGHKYAKDNEFKCVLIEDPTLPGDADGNGKTNMKDLVLVQRYLNGWTVDIDLSVLDLTGDNKVNMKDYVALQRMLNGWS